MGMGNLDGCVEVVGRERVSTGFLKVVVWGGNGKRAGGDDEIKEVTEYVAPLRSIPQPISLTTTQVDTVETTTRGLPLT